MAGGNKSCHGISGPHKSLSSMYGMEHGQSSTHGRVGGGYSKYHGWSLSKHKKKLRDGRKKSSLKTEKTRGQLSDKDALELIKKRASRLYSTVLGGVLSPNNFDRYKSLREMRKSLYSRCFGGPADSQADFVPHDFVEEYKLPTFEDVFDNPLAHSENPVVKMFRLYYNMPFKAKFGPGIDNDPQYHLGNRQADGLCFAVEQELAAMGEGTVVCSDYFRHMAKVFFKEMLRIDMFKYKYIRKDKLKSMISSGISPRYRAENPESVVGIIDDRWIENLMPYSMDAMKRMKEAATAKEYPSKEFIGSDTDNSDIEMP